MFPLRDDNPTLALSLVTLAFIVLNAAVWVLLQGMGTEPGLSASVCDYGLIPARVLGLARPGARVELGPGVACVIGAVGGGWLTVLSSMFMHGSWFHIIGNMWFLWVFGNNVEDSMGHARFALFYLICGVAAAAAQTMVNPSSNIPMVGASGAIGGVMGAYAILYPHARVHTLIFLGFYARMIIVPAWVMLGYWFVLQILSGLPSVGSDSGGVAFWAHVGGFAAGVVLIYLFRNRRLVEAHRNARLRSASPW
jgi:membrane associated rhomboid family serine protease